MKKLLILALSTTACIQLANGALLYSDSFSYDTGTLATDNMGGWVTSVNERYDIGSGSLGYGTLATSGNKLTGTAGLEYAMKPVSLTAGTTSWVSYTLQMDGLYTHATDPKDNMHIGFAQADNTAHDEAGVRLRADGGGDVYLYADANNTLSSTRYKVSTGSTMFIVMKYDDTENDVTVWVNPTNLGTTDAAPTGAAFTTTASGTGSADNYFRLRSRNNSADFQFDELRIGSTYADISPIPEPATIGLVLGTGGVLLVIRRRFMI